MISKFICFGCSSRVSAFRTTVHQPCIMTIAGRVAKPNFCLYEKNCKDVKWEKCND